MALLLLAQDWTTARNGKVVALTVDHGLRKESADEARQVARWCKSLDVEHHTLRWQHGGDEVVTQEDARAARYRLLTDWCKAHNVLHLLTAHHADDQAETLLFRLARGSRLDGLAAMPIVSYVHGVRLLRPLLHVHKIALQEWLRLKNQPWIEDPSNKNPRYTRTHIRRHMQQEERFLALAKTFGTIRHRLEHHTAQALATCFSLFPAGYGTLDCAAFQNLAPEYALRSLSAFLTTLSGATYAPRHEKLQRLTDEIRAGHIRTRRTFFGCVLQYQRAKNRLLIYREQSSIAAPMLIKKGECQLWDQRFAVSYEGKHAPAELILKPLGTAGKKALRAKTHAVEPAAMPSLPALWHLEKLMAVPHIGYTRPQAGELRVCVRYMPVKPLAGTAFYAMNKDEKTR